MKEVNRSVSAIRVILTRVGVLPQLLIAAYLHEIKTGDVSVTRRFYEQLALNCPSALDYFTESALKVRENEEDRVKGALREIPIN
ncbi:MAG TPA: hypothetical protein VEG65_03040 [Candidatus Bathyarchaeia archaeon]|nr:hypothetical protein [Candidatus Bathyarchaeia archaeon]